jgi:hypothetical protein
LKLAKSAPQPIRLLEENQLKNEPMLYGVGNPTGYHPIISATYSDAIGALGAGSDAFGGLFAVNYARTFSPNPPEEGNWTPDAASGERLSGNSSRLWHRAAPAPYIRNESELVKVDVDELSLTSSSLRAIAMDSMAQGAGAQATNAAYVARVSDYDARRYHLYPGSQMAEAQLQRWTPHEIRLHARAGVPRKGEGAVLPLSEPYSPGWHAETSSGHRLPVLAINGLQRGLVLPSGEHNVRLVYSPFSFRFGLFVSLISATVLISFGMGTLNRRVIRGQKKVKKVIRQAQSATRS